MDFHCRVNFTLDTDVNLTGLTCINKIRDDVSAAGVNEEKLERGSLFHVYKSRLYVL